MRCVRGLVSCRPGVPPGPDRLGYPRPCAAAHRSSAGGPWPRGWCCDPSAPSTRGGSRLRQPPGHCQHAKIVKVKVRQASISQGREPHPAPEVRVPHRVPARAREQQAVVVRPDESRGVPDKIRHDEVREHDCSLPGLGFWANRRRIRRRRLGQLPRFAPCVPQGGALRAPRAWRQRPASASEGPAGHAPAPGSSLPRIGPAHAATQTRAARCRLLGAPLPSSRSARQERSLRSRRMRGESEPLAAPR